MFARSARCALCPIVLFTLAMTIEAAPANAVHLSKDVTLPTIPGLTLHKVETEAGTYFLETSGAGLAALLDRDGNDWLGFHPAPGSRAGGEFRGFPNAVHQEAGNYFHPQNQGTEPSTVRIEHESQERVTITAVSRNGLWACRYDFFPTHCTFTMTKMSPDHRYWVLYEGTPGGSFDDTDWWITSALKERQPIGANHEGDIPGPEWIAFGDAKLPRVIFLLSHQDDASPDRFYQMEKKMTVFGFGRHRGEKHLAIVPRSFSIGLLETTDHAEIGNAMRRLLEKP
jgi:hypothetical protein